MKKEMAAEALASIEIGGCMTSSGGVLIERIAEGNDDARAIRWTVNGNTEDLTELGAIKRLAAYRPVWLERARTMSAAEVEEARADDGTNENEEDQVQQTEAVEKADEQERKVIGEYEIPASVEEKIAEDTAERLSKEAHADAQIEGRATGGRETLTDEDIAYLEREEAAQEASAAAKFATSEKLRKGEITREGHDAVLAGTVTLDAALIEYAPSPEERAEILAESKTEEGKKNGGRKATANGNTRSTERRPRPNADKKPSVPALPEEQQRDAAEAGEYDLGNDYAVRVEIDGETEVYSAYLNGERITDQRRANKVIRLAFKAQTWRDLRGKTHALTFADAKITAVPHPKKEVKQDEETK